MASTYDSPTGWYRELDPGEKRTFWACFGGWMLDAMDVQIFSFAIPAIIVAFAITNADAGLIGTVTLLTSAFGGWFAGALSDRFGRVRTLQITIVWFAFFTFLCGFAQTYAQLFIFRALMGLGFGGEWAAGAVLMGEVIRGARLGAGRAERQGGRQRAERLGGWLGYRGHHGHLVFQRAPAGHRLACIVLGRAIAGVPRLFRAAFCRRAKGVHGDTG